MDTECSLETQGFKRGSCLVDKDGIKDFACKVTLKEKDGELSRLITSIHLSRPENYLSIYQSGCNLSCKKCHSWEFSKNYKGEWYTPQKTKDFPLFGAGCCFTDDTVLTLAVAKGILHGSDYITTIREVGRRYPNAGYGGSFIHWLFSESPRPYNSWGNGSAMRVSPVGFAFDSILKAFCKRYGIRMSNKEL